MNDRCAAGCQRPRVGPIQLVERKGGVRDEAGRIEFRRIGLMQTWASVEHGYWYARSPEFLQTGLIDLSP